MKEFEVWSEGYVATGEHGTADFLGKYSAETFPEACLKAMKDKNWEIDKYYNPATNSYWACRFFDNEADARKLCG